MVSLFVCWQAHATGPLLTTISDVIYRANGQPATGQIVITWQGFTTSDGYAVPAGTTSLIIPSNGAISLLLAPNAGATPSGSYYKSTFKLTDGTSSTEYWVVPSGPTTTIAAIRSSLLPAQVAAQFITRSQLDAALAAEDAKVVHNAGPESVGGIKTFGSNVVIQGQLSSKVLEGWRFADQFGGADIGAKNNAAVTDIGSGGGTVVTPIGANSFSTTITTPNQYINFQGQGPGTALTYTGSGNALNVSQGNVSVRDLSITGTTSAGNLIEEANGSGNPSIANFAWYQLGLSIGGNAAGLALFDLNGSYPGNVYGNDFYSPRFVTSASHGLQLRSNSGTPGTAAQPPVTNIFGGVISGMGGYGLNVDATGSNGVPGNGLTVIGTNLQGNTLGAVNCNTCGNATFMDLYTENSATQSPLTFGPKAGNRDIGIFGNPFNGGSVTPAGYCVNIYQNTGATQTGFFSAYNQHLNCNYGYNINNLTNSWLGMADTVNVTSPGAGKITNWTTNTGWQNMVVWDGTSGYSPLISASIEPYLYIGSDHTYYDSPLFLYGVKPGTQTAKFQLGEMTPAAVSSGNGTSATAIFKVTGANGGNTTDATTKTAGAGAGINLTAGNGGTAPVGSTLGAAGPVIIQGGRNTGLGTDPCGVSNSTTCGYVQIQGGFNAASTVQAVVALNDLANRRTLGASVLVGGYSGQAMLQFDAPNAYWSFLEGTGGNKNFLLQRASTKVAIFDNNGSFGVGNLGSDVDSATNDLYVDAVAHKTWLGQGNASADSTGLVTAANFNTTGQYKVGGAQIAAANLSDGGGLIKQDGVITTTASASDALIVPGLTASSHCYFAAANPAAATLTGVYIVTSANTATLNHLATAGAVFNIACALN